MKRGFAARKGTGASLLPAANASLLVLQLYTAVAREIAADFLHYFLLGDGENDIIKAADLPKEGKQCF